MPSPPFYLGNLDYTESFCLTPLQDIFLNPREQLPFQHWGAARRFLFSSQATRWRWQQILSEILSSRREFDPNWILYQYWLTSPKKSERDISRYGTFESFSSVCLFSIMLGSVVSSPNMCAQCNFHLWLEHKKLLLMLTVTAYCSAPCWQILNFFFWCDGDDSYLTVNLYPILCGTNQIWYRCTFLS